MSNAATLTNPLPCLSGGPVHLLLSAFRGVQARIERTRATEHLNGLDDRLLADRGLARRDIAKLFR